MAFLVRRELSEAANFSGQSWTLDLRRLDDNHSYPSIFSKVYLGDTSNHWYVRALFHHREPRKLHDSQSMPMFSMLHFITQVAFIVPSYILGMIGYAIDHT